MEGFNARTVKCIFARIGGEKVVTFAFY